MLYIGLMKGGYIAVSVIGRSFALVMPAKEKTSSLTILRLVKYELHKILKVLWI